MKNQKYNTCRNCEWRSICALDSCNESKFTYREFHNKYEEYRNDLHMRDETYNDLITEMLGDA